jgi:hypothetical protein
MRLEGWLVGIMYLHLWGENPSTCLQSWLYIARDARARGFRVSGMDETTRKMTRATLSRKQAARMLGCRSYDLTLLAGRGHIAIQRVTYVRERVPLEDVERLLADRARREALDEQTRAVFGAGLDSDEGTK